ncbi:hypothetical protein OS493_011930 [Desmophyllum pertusum]|uniref:SH2 domain-containing protein n=1 Tax=Desmophyllum pertusum TaxID=174260 RepID=A0A9W9YHI5_9CNID|nr:hypothetical protein OS493_011930 [Desmophyllum pertusum]
MSSPSVTIYDWDVERMLVCLREESLHECVRPFSLKKINGIAFLNLSDNDIKAFKISQESKKKLAKLLKRMKGKRQNVRKRFDGETSVIKESKKPSVVPAHDDLHEDDCDGWSSDEFSDDPDEEEEEEESDSGGEYIEPTEDELIPPQPEGSPSKEAPNIPLGLVAQLKAGLNGTIPRNPWKGPPVSPQKTTHPVPFDEDPEDDQIYDEPPDGVEDEVYEQPSDDSSGGIVIRPMSHKKIIRCESDKGEYIDARPPKYSDKDAVVCPPAPCRPPKSFKVNKPPLMPPTPVEEQEIYDEVPEDEELGRTQVVEPEQETYEVPDDGAQDTVIQRQEQPLCETYEVPGPEPEQETYELPEEPAPARPPPRKPAGGLGWKPPKPNNIHVPPQKMKSPLPKETSKPKPASKPVLASKPQISPKPNPAGPALPASRSSRLYPSLKDHTVSPEPPSTKRPSGLPSPPGGRPPIPPPSPESPTKTEKNNNEISKNTSTPSRIQPPGRRPVPAPIEESPPPPPRPGSKPFHHKLPRLSDSDNQDNSPVIPVSQFPPMKQKKSPLPAPPEQKPVDPLKQSPWFHGPLDKKIAESALKAFSKEGAFIVRNSSKDPNNYAMSLFFKKSVRHLRMPRINNKFVLGDSGKVEFTTIVELVDYYSQNHLDLRSGGSTSLTAACPVKK